MRTCGLHAGRYPPQPVSVLGPAPTLSPSFLLVQPIFEPNLFPYKYTNILKPGHSQWLSERKIAINVSKSTVTMFARARWRFIQP